MGRLLKDRYFWYIGALLGISVLLIYLVEPYVLSRTSSEVEQHLAHMTWMTLRSLLLLLAVVIAAWRFGIKGGVATVSFIGLILVPHIIGEVVEPFGLYMLAQYGIWGGIVILFIWLVGSRKRTEEVLQKEKETAQKYLDVMGAILVAITADEKVSLINRKGSEILEYQEEEIIGKNWFDNFLPEGTRDEVKTVFGKLMTGEIEPVEYFENSVLTKSGEERIIAWHNTVLTGETGNIVGTLSSGEDITERKQAEAQIEHAAQEWRTTFDSITDFVSIQDKDFKLVRVNKAYADFFKMKPGELVGKKCYEVLHGTKVPWQDCPAKQVLKTKKSATKEFFEPRLGVYLSVSVSPIFDDKGEAVGTVHFAKDITERKQMEEKLVITDRLASIGELASGIAHELNNPLTGVIGFSELLLEKDVSGDIREDIAIIHHEAKRVAEVVKNLLTFARKHPPSKQLVDINTVIAGVLKLRAYDQKVNNIRVITHFASDLPRVMADYFQIQQVFFNIVINAEYFMTEVHNKGTLTITTERVGNVIRISFVDDGPGISKEDLGHLFDPFFTTKEIGKGTGLGLSICHGIITEHNGRIYAESEPGKGATFTVEVPVTTIDEKKV